MSVRTQVRESELGIHRVGQDLRSLDAIQSGTIEKETLPERVTTDGGEHLPGTLE